MKRASFIAKGLAMAALGAAPMSTIAGEEAAASLKALEARSGGRLGVVVIDTGNGKTLMYRPNERFPMCSTFKVLAVAAVLDKVDSGQLHLAQRITYSTSDLLEYAPISKQHVQEGMTIEQLCAAAIEYSDNTAANLLIKLAGGPSAVTKYVRSIGDEVTRLDRTEPALNESTPGDPRDTTSPLAMARDMQTLLLKDALSKVSSQQLAGWLVQSKTGANLLRSGLPHDWRVGDKTGLGGAHNSHGDSNTRNDIAIAWPPRRPPLIVTAYLTQCTLPADGRDAILAGVGSVIRRLDRA